MSSEAKIDQDRLREDLVARSKARMDRDRLREDLVAIATSIVERIPLKTRTLLALKGVDISASTLAICDDLAALPDDDLVLILLVLRWEAHALLGETSDPLALDARTRAALRRVIDVFTKGL